MNPPMKIEAVSVCIGYGDFLAATLPENLPHLDDLVIVTSTEDRETQAVCARYGVRCLPTDIHQRFGEKFNKSRAVNHGLNHLRRNDWLLHLDADIVLPTRFRWMLYGAELDPQCMYGFDRVNCPNYEEWQRFKASGEPQFEWSYLVKPPRGWTMGARLVHGDYGYCPIGYAQLWHGGTQKRYPIMADGDAEHTDVLHSTYWPRPKRHLVPEVLCVHLESEPSQMGVNWKGRKTKRFGPNVSCPPAPKPPGPS